MTNSFPGWKIRQHQMPRHFGVGKIHHSINDMVYLMYIPTAGPLFWCKMMLDEFTFTIVLLDK